MKKIFLTFLFWTAPAASEACSVCFGNPDSSMSQGLQMAILLLLGILSVVLGGFILFFMNLRKRTRHCTEREQGHEF